MKVKCRLLLVIARDCIILRCEWIPFQTGICQSTPKRGVEEAGRGFVGNVEGRAILSEQADVSICDGFVGNIILKFAESINAVYTTNLRRRIGKRLQYKFAAYLLKPAFRRLKKTFDYAEYGGVPLLGVNGVVIIGHGGSSAKAICNAIFEAEKIVNENVNGKIEQEINLLTKHNGLAISDAIT